MSFEVTGKIVEVMPVNQVSDKFRKREFVIEKKETGASTVFVDYIKFQLIQEKCELINESYLNEEVKVFFNLKGNKWERDGKVNYFTNLDAWKIERMAESGKRQEADLPANYDEMIPDDNTDDMDDLPF